MKHSRLVFAAVAVLALGTWASFAVACENKAKSTTAKAKQPSYDATTVTAQGGASSADAVLVGAGGSCSHGASKSTSATAAGAGGSCSGHGAKSATAHTAHADCDACADMAFCDGEVTSLGATVQIVPLKNGVMYVYTADDANKIHAVQASMARRNDHMSGVMAAGDKAKLCPSCKTVRGAIASGKLSREFVNIEGGCLTLMTSNDPATVAKIYSLAGIKGPMSIKS